MRAINKFVQVHTGPAALLSTPGEKVDETTGVKDVEITVGKKKYTYYGWGPKNNKPNEMIKLAESNGDILNLLDTRADFMHGAGIGLFTRENGENKEVSFEKYREFWESHDLDDLLDAMITQLVYFECAAINISVKGKVMSFRIKDAITVRAAKVSEKEGEIKEWLLSSSWEEGAGKSISAVAVPAFDFQNRKQPESILFLRKHQPGHFYYPFPRWWSQEKNIRIANRIPDRISNELDSEGNIGAIVHVSNQYIDDMVREQPKKEDGSEYTREELKDGFVNVAKEFLFGDGPKKFLIDFCATDKDGKLINSLEIEHVKKTIAGKENNEIYQGRLTSICNAVGVLGGLSGISDQKMNSSGGTEIRESANFQQFYRTPRERQIALKFFNRVVLPYMKEGETTIPDGAFFAFKNIVTETLDKNPTSTKTVLTNAN